MTTLFRRAYRLTIGELQFEELDIDFSVERTGRRDPNRASVRVWNLTREHRDAIARLDVVRVELLAGYGEELHAIFVGDLTDVSSGVDGADIWLEAKGGDGDHHVRRARALRTQRTSTSVAQALEDIARTLGVGIGNAVESFARAGFEGTSSSALRGNAILSGTASVELERMCIAAGLEWSIQDGVLQVVRQGEALRTTATLLDRTTGLLGSPTLGRNGLITLETELVPHVFPGALVRVESDVASGTYRVRSTTHSGDTFGERWGISIKARDATREETTR